MGSFLLHVDLAKAFVVVMRHDAIAGLDDAGSIERAAWLES